MLAEVYECVYCGLIGDQVMTVRSVDLEPMGDQYVERESFYLRCNKCGTDMVEVVERDDDEEFEDE